MSKGNSQFVLPSSAEDRKKIQNAIKEASNALFRIDSEQSLVKDIADAMKDEYSLKPGDFKKMVRVYHSAKYQELISKSEEFTEMYEGILTGIDPSIS